MMLGLLKKMLSTEPRKNEGVVICGGEAVRYDIVRSNRRTMSIVIRRDDCSVSVRVPLSVSNETITDFVDSRKEWIERHRSRIAENNRNRIVRRYEDGATHLFLGRSYTLRLHIDKAEGVIIDGDTLHVSVKSPDRCQKVLYEWYARMAEVELMKVARPLIHMFAEERGRQPSAIKFVKAKSYWGQCSSTGMIKLNIELVRAPIPCIEYIVMHELCHLVHHNHSSRFHALVECYVPDWKARKKLLEATVSCRC